jgi:hypothetical protein
MICIPSFMTIDTDVQAMLRSCLSNFRGCSVGITDGRDLLSKYRAEIASCGIIYITSSTNIGTGIQAILMFCRSNLRGCNVGITDGRDL